MAHALVSDLISTKKSLGVSSSITYGRSAGVAGTFAPEEATAMGRELREVIPNVPLHNVPLRPPGFLGDKALAAMKEEQDLAQIREDEEMAELAREFEEEMEQRKLMKEFEEEQRQRKAQYEATQRVQAQVKGKQARAEVAKKKAGA